MKDIEGIEETQFSNENMIKRISALLKDKINAELQNQKKTNSLDRDLGVLSYSLIKKLNKLPVASGYVINPAQIKGAQSPGASYYDYNRYKQYQLVPFFVSNKKNENIAGGKGNKKLYILYFIPAIGVNITNDNYKIHQILLKNNAKKKYNFIEELKPIKLEEDELISTLNSFITGNFSTIKSSMSLQGARRSNAESETPGENSDNNSNIQDNYDILNMYNRKNSYRNFIDMNDFHKSSLTSLLFEEKSSSLLRESEDTLDTENTKNIPKNKMDATAAPRLAKSISSVFENNGKPKGWEEAKNENDKAKLVYRFKQNPLGAIKDKNSIIQAFCKKPIMGIKIDPYNIKDQHEGIDAEDFKRFMQRQVMFFVLKDNTDKIIGAESSSGVKSFYVIAVPPLYTQINVQNFNKVHKSLFGISGELPEKAVFWYEDIKKVPVIQISTSDKLNHEDLLDKFLKTGQTTSLQQIARVQQKIKGTKLSSNDNETQEDSSKEKVNSESFVHSRGLKALLEVTDQEAQDVMSDYLDVHFATPEGEEERQPQAPDWLSTIIGASTNTLTTANNSRLSTLNNNIDNSATTTIIRLGSANNTAQRIYAYNNSVYLRNSADQNINFNDISNEDKKTIIRNIVYTIQNMDDENDRQALIDAFNQIFGVLNLNYSYAAESYVSPEEASFLEETRNFINRLDDVLQFYEQRNRDGAYYLRGETCSFYFLPEQNSYLLYNSSGEIRDSTIIVLGRETYNPILSLIIKKLITSQYNAFNSERNEVENSPELAQNIARSFNILSQYQKALRTQRETQGDLEQRIRSHVEGLGNIRQGIIDNIQEDVTQMLTPLQNIGVNASNIIQEINAEIVNNISAPSFSDEQINNFVQQVLDRRSRDNLNEAQIVELINETVIPGDSQISFNNISAQMRNVSISEEAIQRFVRMLVVKGFGYTRDRALPDLSELDVRNDEIVAELQTFNAQLIALESEDVGERREEAELSLRNQINRLESELREIEQAREEFNEATRGQVNINQEQFRRLFANVYTDWVGIKASDIQSGPVNSGNIINNPNLINEEKALLNEIKAMEIIGAFTGLKMASGALAASAAALGPFGIALTVGGAIIGKIIGGKFGKVLDESILKDVNGVLSYWAKSGPLNDNDFEVALQKDQRIREDVANLARTLSPQLNNLLRQEIMFSFRQYFNGIQEDILTPMRITVDGIDDPRQYNITGDNAASEFRRISSEIEEESRVSRLRSNLNDRGTELINQLEMLPYNVCREMGTGVKEAVTTKTSKVIMKRVLQTSPILSRLVNSIIERNQIQDETEGDGEESSQPESVQDGYIYQKGLKFLFENTDGPQGYRRRGVRRDAVETYSAIEVFDEIKSHTINAIRETTNIAQKIDEELIRQLRNKSSGYGRFRVIKKSDADQIISNFFGIPTGAFTKAIVGESRQSNLNNINLASREYRNKVIQEDNNLLLGSIAELIFEDNKLNMFNQSVDKNRSNQRNVEKQSYLNEKAFYGSISKLIFEDNSQSKATDVLTSVADYEFKDEDQKLLHTFYNQKENVFYYKIEKKGVIKYIKVDPSDPPSDAPIKLDVKSLHQPQTLMNSDTSSNLPSLEVKGEVVLSNGKAVQISLGRQSEVFNSINASGNEADVRDAMNDRLKEINPKVVISPEGDVKLEVSDEFKHILKNANNNFRKLGISRSSATKSGRVSEEHYMNKLDSDSDSELLDVDNTDLKAASEQAVTNYKLFIAKKNKLVYHKETDAFYSADKISDSDKVGAILKNTPADGVKPKYLNSEGKLVDNVDEKASLSDLVKQTKSETMDLRGLNPKNVSSDYLKSETESAEPTEPAEEVEPTEPTEPAEEVEPTEPAEPAEEVEPAEPAEEVEPAEPAEEVEPAKPTEPAEEVEPAKPTEPADVKANTTDAKANTTDAKANATDAKEAAKEAEAAAAKAEAAANNASNKAVIAKAKKAAKEAREAVEELESAKTPEEVKTAIAKVKKTASDAKDAAADANKVASDAKEAAADAKTESFSFEATVFNKIPYLLWGYRLIKNIYDAKKNNYRFNDLQQYVTGDNEFFLKSISTPIAYQMTNALIGYSGLSASGLKITGALPTEASSEEKGLTGDDAFSGISKVFSSEAQRQAKESVKQGRLAKIFNREVSDEDIAKQMEKQIREKIENICIGMTLKYDEEKMSEVRADVDAGVERYNNKKAGRDKIGMYGAGITTALALGTVASGGAFALGMPLVYGALGAAAGLGLGGLGGSIASEEIYNKNKRKGVGKNKRQNIANDEKVKKDVTSIVAILKSQAKKIKKINDSKYIHVNSLKTLLFENAKISDNDIKKLLKSSNVSIYSFMKQTDENFNEAEKDLVASVKDLLEIYFGISVAESADDSQRARNVQAQAVANTAVSQTAPAGQHACPAMAPYTHMMPMPYNMNQQFQNPMQIANMMSMSGGMNMFYFMMMMMQNPQQFQQMMQNVNGMSVKEAAPVIEKEIPELNDLEKSLEMAIKKINSNRPFLTKDTVRSIYYTFKKSNIEKNINRINVESVNITVQVNDELFNDEQMFIASIRSIFNITDKDVEYGDEEANALSSWIERTAFESLSYSSSGDVAPDYNINNLVARKLLGLRIDINSSVGQNERNAVINSVEGINILNENLSIDNNLLKGKITNYLFNKKKVYNQTKYDSDILKKELYRIWDIK